MEEKPKKNTGRKGNGKSKVTERGLSVEETKKRQQKREEKKENNDMVEKAKEQVTEIISSYIENPQPFLKEKEIEIAEQIEKYGNKFLDDLENSSPLAKKDYALEISQYVCKPILSATGKTLRHTANSLLVASDFYWDKIVIPLNEKMHYIPMLADLLRLLNISITTFNNYSLNESEEVREACQLIYDRFITYYQRNGMLKNISEIMSMFVLKTTFKQRESDTPQIQINNISTSASDTVNKYARQHGYEIYEE